MPSSQPKLLMTMPINREIVSKYLLSKGMAKQAQKFLECRLSAFRMMCMSCGYELIHPVSCSLSFCDKCGYYSQYRMVKKHLPILKQIKNLRLLTLTFKRTEITSKGEIRKMFALIKRFILKFYRGSLTCMEINHDGHSWYIHAHNIVQGDYIDQKVLSSAWAKMSGNMIVDIRAIYDKRGALSYLTKYMSKSPKCLTNSESYSGMVAKLIYLFYRTKKMRTFGTLYHASLNLLKANKFIPKCENCGSTDMLFNGYYEGYYKTEPSCVP